MMMAGIYSSPYLKGGTKYDQYKTADFLGIGKTCEGLPIAKGSTGEKVKEIQSLLQLPTDGVFGSSTEAAVIKRLGTPSVSCEQYKSLTGKGITPEKVGGAASLITGILGAIKKNPETPVYTPSNPPAQEESKTPWVWIGIGAVVLVSAIIIFFSLKK